MALFSQARKDTPRSVRIIEAHLTDWCEEDFLHRLSPHMFVLQNAERPLPVHGGICLRRKLLRCGGDDTPQVDDAATTGQEVVLAARGSTFRGGVLNIMHGRSRMTIDPRIPTIGGGGLGELGDF